MTGRSTCCCLYWRRTYLRAVIRRTGSPRRMPDGDPTLHHSAELLSVLLVSKQVRDEAQKTYYGSNRFNFTSPTEFPLLLGRLKAPRMGAPQELVHRAARQ